jgi:hypothetical protein
MLIFIDKLLMQIMVLINIMPGLILKENKIRISIGTINNATFIYISGKAEMRSFYFRYFK